MREERRGGHTRDDFPAMRPGVAAQEPGLPLERRPARHASSEQPHAADA